MNVPQIIPPLSIVKIVKADDTCANWKTQIGKRFRIGYYSRQDGLETIWLVDDKGNYCQTTDRQYLIKYFDIETLSNETNLFGDKCPPLGPI